MWGHGGVGPGVDLNNKILEARVGHGLDRKGQLGVLGVREVVGACGGIRGWACSKRMK